jgi:CRISPR-associated protein Cmr2
MPYLFQVSIGPVQSFIASARRTRDLWFGSWLLSELAKAAAHEIVQQEDETSLIFPAPADSNQLQPGTDLNVANKIVARVKQPPETIGPLIEAAVQARLLQIWKQAREQVKGELENDTIAEAQIRDMVECFWVALPLPNEAAYAYVRTSLEALMAARKNTRDFAAVTWGDYRPKSSITGHLESVIPEGLYPVHRRDHNGERERKASVLLERYGAGPAERLSGVDLLKRHGQGPVKFISTSHIAAIPFLQQFDNLRDQTLLSDWGTYLRLLPPEVVKRERVSKDFKHPFFADHDGALLFEERLDDVFADKNKLHDAKEALREFFRQARPIIGAGRPSPYYAILHADGDGMGAVIDAQAQAGPERHRELSRALDEFAANARAIVAQHHGALIYSGGDDVLAFVPLHTLLVCAQELAREFRQQLEPFKNAKGDSSTLSVGIAVVHHLLPLSDALDLARDAEKSAKQVQGIPTEQNPQPQDKNALAITVSKRSGGETTVKGQWDTVDKRLERLINLHRHNNLPDGAAYELRDLHERLMPPPAENQEQFWEMLRTEAIRILLRKRLPGGKTAFDQTTAANHVQDIGMNKRTLADVASELIVARLLADAADLAQLKLPPLESGEAHA